MGISITSCLWIMQEYPTLLCNSHLKGIRAARPPAQFTNDPQGFNPSADLQPPRAKGKAGSNLASPQLICSRQSDDLRLEDDSWKLQKEKSRPSPESKTKIIGCTRVRSRKIIVFQEIKSILNLRQILREAEELGKDGD